MTARVVDFCSHEMEKAQLNGLENRPSILQVWLTTWLSGVVVELPMKLSSPV